MRWPRDGTAPLYQYAYGSYGLSTDPNLRVNWLSLLNRGFVMAIAHIRGGQERAGPGDEWGSPKEKAYYHDMLSYSPYEQLTSR